MRAGRVHAVRKKKEEAAKAGSKLAATTAWAEKEKKRAEAKADAELAAQINKDENQLDNERLKPPRMLRWKNYRDIHGLAIFLTFLILAIMYIQYAQTSTKPAELACADEPCLKNQSGLDYVELRSEVYKDPNALIQIEDFHPEHPEELLCHACLSKCRSEGTCISNCTDATQECYDTNQRCLDLTTTSNACPTQFDGRPQDTSCTDATSMAACVDRCQTVMQHKGVDCNEDIFRTTKEEGCYYLNSQRCQEDQKRSRSKLVDCHNATSCFYEIKDSDPCIPPKISMEEDFCKFYMDLNNCHFFSPAEHYNRSWVDIECSHFRQTAYHQIVREELYWVYVEIAVFAMVLSLVSTCLFMTCPQHISVMVHGGLQAVLFAAIVTSGIYDYRFIFLWVFLMMLHGLFMLFTLTHGDPAAQMLDVAIDILHVYKNLVLLGLVETFCKVTLFCGWIWLYITINGRKGGFVDFIIFMLLLWFGQMIRYANFVTTAGVTATWYFRHRPPAPIWRALRRAVTTSLGSVCIGATVMSVIKGLIITFAFLRSQGPIFNALCSICLGSVDLLARKFNNYGFARVAIYGTPFRTSSKAAFRQLKAAGIYRMTEDKTVSGLCVFASFFTGMICMGVGYLLVKLEVHDELDVDALEMRVLICLPCFCIGFISGLVTLDQAEAIVVTFYVCFAEEPHLLNSHEPELYADLMQQWYEANLDVEEEVDENAVANLDESDTDSEELNFQKQRVQMDASVQMRREEGDEGDRPLAITAA
uniref:Choline transporter-like protein n=1 Tax=Pyramimonas obovata TaxID=1411642 RepID=A0A7S0WUP9_9CHLO|mmetsp:Transcript_39758/g.86572  ORF Transcript_39758/g.86572 Transcript_39758/m.86572 type:complete len:760 (+) Transcript_39758:189-2468(+)|eukprot:CAMPEP_0118928664 /NCGR_PEP_ID=MMETSP1169-20130426/5865_1 /TAXON_ID=36882 /ORGANISM="Pyramimonas obovata, Strain CCMP722" /LENGTH=759 /DNA_ID=CAMNT_0006870693 /DNA_START=142 /DNA_END=2421 /DNA_ORIENTATION=+